MITVYEQKEEEELVCKECGGRCIPSNGNILCEECGLVTGRELKEGVHLIGEANPDDQGGGFVRYSSPTKTHVHDKGLGSVISSSVTGRMSISHLRGLSAKEQHHAFRLSYNHRRLSKKDDSLRRHLITLYHTCGVLGINHVHRNQIALMLRKAMRVRKGKATSDKMFAGQTIAVACTQYIVKKHKLAISNDDILEVWDLSGRAGGDSHAPVNSCRTWLQKVLGITYDIIKSIDLMPMTVSLLRGDKEINEKLNEYKMDPDDYFRRLETKANILLTNTSYVRYQGKNPYTIAASCLYVVAGLVSENKICTQINVGSATNTAEYTIRDQCAKIWQKVLPEMIENNIIRFDWK